MPRYANREMLTAPPPRPGDRPAPAAAELPEWEGGAVKMRYDDGSGRAGRVRPRAMNHHERRDFPRSIRRLSRAHAQDLQALANI